MIFLSEWLSKNRKVSVLLDNLSFDQSNIITAHIRAYFRHLSRVGSSWNAFFWFCLKVLDYKTFKFAFFFRGVSSSNCPKFTKVCPFLFILQACPAFLKYSLHIKLCDSHCIESFVRPLGMYLHIIFGCKKNCFAPGFNPQLQTVNNLEQSFLPADKSSKHSRIIYEICSKSNSENSVKMCEISHNSTIMLTLNTCFSIDY